jgi:hypothetical protein
MKAEEARDILRTNNLFDKKTSKAILNAIVLGRDIKHIEFPDTGIKRKIDTLRQEYWNLRKKLPRNVHRNLPFYMLIQDKYQGFQWKETQKGTIVHYNFKGLKPSLLSLLTGVVPQAPGSAIKNGSPLARLAPEQADALVDALREADCVSPDDHQMGLIVDWLKRGLAGEPLTIISPVCPDYAVEDGEAACHRFTFSGVGTGIGVTAKRLFESLPVLSQLWRGDFGLKLTHYVCPGDFEAFSAETNARLGLDEETFIDRLEMSRRSLLVHAPAPIETRLFTSLCCGKAGWVNLHADILKRMQDGAFGPLEGEAWLRAIALGRRGLYDRWYNVEDQEPAFYEAIAIRQGAEYAAMGHAIATHPDCKNPLILGADDHKMGAFYGLTSSIPVLYLRRNYE